MVSARKHARTAAALLIGNELLSGKVPDENLFPLAKTLRALGISLERVVVVGDRLPTLVGELRDLRDRYDVVFTSGGVGPTHDDVTVEAVAQAMNVAVRSHPDLIEVLQGIYGEKCSDAHLQMARVPEGCELLTSDDVRWPTVVMGNIWLMPGVPELFRMKLAVVRQNLEGPTPMAERALFLRLDEVTLKPAIDAVVKNHPEVEVGSYPKWFDETYKTQVTFDGKTEQAVEAACRQLELAVSEEQSFRRGR